jgi:hypothetical protein
MLDEPPLIARADAGIDAMSLKRYTLTAHCDEEWNLGFPAADCPEQNEANV